MARRILTLTAGCIGLALAAGAACAGDEAPPLDLPPDAGLREPYDPFFETDWSLGLRGTFQQDANGKSFETLILPKVALLHEGRRAKLLLRGEAELSKDSDEGVLRALRLSLGTEYGLDRNSRLLGDAELFISRASSGDPDVAEDVDVPPLVAGGTATLEWRRESGRVSLGLRGSLGRTVYGPTTLTSGVEADNAGQNVWSYGTGARVGIGISPVVAVFADAEVERSQFDAPVAGSGLTLDGETYSIRTGLSGNWREVWAAEISVGLGLRDFDDEEIAPIRATLYDASLTYRPDETLSLRGAFSTAITPPGPDWGGTARLEYRATAEAGYAVNPWLALRASAAWFRAESSSSGSWRKGASVGLGADYTLNSHTVLSTDYVFSRSETEVRPAEDVHRVLAGITFAR